LRGQSDAADEEFDIYEVVSTSTSVEEGEE